MSNNHEGHNHSAPNLHSINGAFYIGIGLNSIFTLIEFIIGYQTNSLALVSDASHNLSDVASLIISLIGMKFAQKVATKSYTYGYKKASILASLINAVLLVCIVINIIREGIERLDSVPVIAGKAIMITAFIGVLINTVSAFLFFKGQKHDINVKGAFLHLLVDAFVSLGVVISGIIIHYTNWNIVDPLISFVIAFVIFVSTWGLLKESVKLTLDGTPKEINLDEIKETLLKNDGVKGIHHLHVWALSSSQNALTVHLIFENNVEFSKAIELKQKIKHDLEHNNIHHSTLEYDFENLECLDKKC